MLVRMLSKTAYLIADGGFAYGGNWHNFTHRYRRMGQAIAFLLTVFLLVSPANAHLTDVSSDVAGTWHIEPNHNPKAGEPAEVWVALTQHGGRIVPLDQCDCQLTVYQGSGAKAVPVLQPSLQAIAAEKYQGIPGAEVVFPQIGQYQLKLTGRPKAAASFQPFELSYIVTVATGNSSVTSTPIPKAQTAVPESNSTTSAVPSANSGGGFGKVLLGLGTIALIAGIVLAALRQWKAKRL